MVPFEKIGQGIFRDVLWLEDGNNRKRNRPNIDRVESAQTAFDGKLFWAVWSATNRQKGEAVVFQILARPVDPATGSFLGELPRVLASASTPLRHPLLVSDGSGDLVLIYEAEAPNGERAIRSMKVAK
jgi:hypothetical protein